MAIRILHLDGNSGFNASVKSLFESEGMDIILTLVQSEHEFQKALDADACDLILAGYSLPDYDGVTALKEARLRRPLIPFIFLSASPGDEAATESLRLGAADYLDKSDLRRFPSAVERVLRASREMKALRKERDEALFKAEAAAKETKHAKDLFMAKVSHEIRTPMNGVVSMANLLAETNLDLKQRQYVKVVQASTDSLMRIIDDILDFSNGERGRLRLELRPFDLLEAVAETMALFEAGAREKGLDLRWSFSRGTPRMVKGDTARLRQILVNLVGNAVKFTDRGWVELRIAPRTGTEEHPGLSFEVEDTGIGIGRRAAAGLFQPFVQSDGSDTRRHGGSGLGLAISRQLVELMGGGIGVVSEPGRGSIFRVELPLEASEAEVAERVPALFPHAEFRGLRILVAEDNAINQEVIASLLEALGCDAPDVVGDGREALAAFRGKEFDIVLMDCQMPDLDGYTATARIRRLEAKADGNRRCYIAAMTADIMPGVEEKCRAAGMDGHLTKPYVIEDLVATLERARELAVAGEFHAAPPPPGHPDGNGGDIDIRILERLRLFGGKESPSVFRDLVQGFLEKGPEKIIAIRELARAREFRPLAFAAHGLKGLCLNFGALSMARECEALQVAAEGGKPDELPPILQRLSAAEDRTRAFLEDMIGAGAADAGTSSAAPSAGSSDG